MSSSEARRAGWGLFWAYTLQSLGLVVLIAVAIRVLLVSSFVMSGNSMVPAIWPGDFLVGFKTRLATYARGDILAFSCDQSAAQICIKRVIGLPGDRIEIREGQIWLNGDSLLKARVSPKWNAEALGQKKWLVMAAEEEPTMMREPIVVAPGKVYVLNDRRDDLKDSRTWGPIAQSQLESRIVRVWLSLDWYEGAELRDWPEIRWNRLLRRVD